MMNAFRDKDYKKVFKPIFFISLVSFLIGTILVRSIPALQSGLISFLIVLGPLFLYLSTIDLTKIVYFTGYELLPRPLYRIGAMLLVAGLPAFLATLAIIPVVIFLEEFGFIK